MARALAKANIERARDALGTTRQLTLPDLKDGEMILYNHYVPALAPGLYGIEAKQTIQTANEELHVYNYESINAVTPPNGQDYPTALQKFTVTAPRFHLDPKTINSYYPPDGFVEEARVLPHIVFKDPHVPWERPYYHLRWFPQASFPDPFARSNSRPPWVALLVFDPEELRLSESDGQASNIPSFDAKALPNSGAFPMSVGDYLTKVTSRVHLEAGSPPGSSEWETLKLSTDPVQIIFPEIALIEAFIPKENIAGFKSTAHVRQVSTVGLPDSSEERQRLYSVCVSHRSGPTSGPDLVKPRTQIVHLLSIENLAHGAFGPQSASQRIGLISLFSWTYTCTPPLPTNFTTIMKTLADQRQMLRPPNPIIDEIATTVSTADTDNMKSAASILHQRLAMGYTISRWRTSTGEETACLNRGPLIPLLTDPTPVVASPSDWPSLSNTGEDYQILDRKLGLMDVSYSSAWQLGKMMGIMDPVFYAALLRLRSAIHKSATSAFRIAQNGVGRAHEVINKAPNIMKAMRDLHGGAGTPKRAALPSAKAPLENGPVFKAFVGAALDWHVRSGERLFSDFELGSGNNTDWEIVSKWISDKMYLSGIPAHYFVTDPSQVRSTLLPFDKKEPIELPPEALRFFYIDDAWMDCFIDGALSNANHYSAEEDVVRLRIKEVYNTYLRTAIQGTSLKPPIPEYGFILRSLLVKAIPELKITVTCKNPSRMPLVRLTKLDDQTLFALLDCLPEEISKIKIAQPPHQQRFVAPISPSPGVQFKLKRLYTSGAAPIWPPIPDGQAPSESEMAGWYNGTTRLVDYRSFVKSLERALPFEDSLSIPPSRFAAEVGSAATALELNDRTYQLEFDPPVNGSPSPMQPRIRQLWTRGGSSGLQPLLLRSTLHPSQRLAFRDPPDVKHMKSSWIAPTVVKPRSKLPNRCPVLVRKFDPAVPSLKASRRIKINTAAPAAQIAALSPPATTQYTLTMRPSYRNASPLPFTSDSPPRKVFSANDYIPTVSPSYLNLLVSVRRTSAPANGSAAPLCALTVVIPTVSQNSTTVEPLLDASHDSLSVQMVHNERLDPIISRSDGQLQVKLVSRKARPNEMIAIPDQFVQNASFVLRMCRIASIQRESTVEVNGEGSVQRGLAEVLVRETYLLDGGGTADVKKIFEIVKMNVEV